MARVTVDIEIPADIATVWADVAELSSHVEWMADAESIEFMGDATSGVGTVMKVVTKIGPLQTNDIIRVVEWAPGESIGVHHEGLVTGTGAFHLEAHGRLARFDSRFKVIVKRRERRAAQFDCFRQVDIVQLLELVADNRVDLRFGGDRFKCVRVAYSFLLFQQTSFLLQQTVFR